MTPRVAIIGAGPSGFYAAEQLLKADFEVDLYDALPTPFGLVRAGVAPDHPKIKSVTRVYSKTADHPAFRFFGGVTLAADVSREELLARYHALLYAVGTGTANRLGIPGENRLRSHPATEFVAWYNGHPEHAERSFCLDGGRAVVVGNGNVAIDVARMLVLGREELAVTDTADHAIAAFGTAAVEEVVVLGRRGPAEAAFTNPELRELGELARADVIVDAAQLVDVAEPDDATRRRNIEIMRDFAQRPPAGKTRRIELRFLRSPLEVLGEGDGPVTGLRVGINRLEAGEDGRMRAVPTGQEEVIECGLVLHAVGYRGQPLPDVPFDADRGLIRNREGRVCEADGALCRGEYAVGWIKRGATGVIGTNKKCATETVAQILADRDAGRLNVPADADGGAIERWLTERVAGMVTWEGWEAIDRHEREAGEPHGRPRVKLVRLDRMRAVAARR